MKGLQFTAEWAPRRDYTVSEFERRTGKAVTGASVWRHPHVHLAEVEEPPLGPKDVRVRPRACGVCGSDVHFYETDGDGYIRYPGLTKFPVVIGHEFSGEVVEAGKDVRDLRVGDLVTVEEMIWCGECVPCRNGWPNQCLNLEEIGFTIDGAMAEQLVVGAKYCWPINALAEVYGSQEAACEAGALCEPTSVAYNGMFVRAEGFKPGGVVAVYGTGPIGFAAIALARAAGASRVIAFEVSPVRQALARQVGADEVHNPMELAAAGSSPHEAVRRASAGAGADMAVEAAGAPVRTIPEMEASLAIGGKVVIIGRAAERAPMYLEHFQTHAAQLYGAQGHSGYGTFQNVIRLMASRRIDLRPIITSRFPLSEGVDAIARASLRQDGKVMVKS
ncbi:MAG: zinc-binding dehydrogenase [Bacillati bacterium ANGP1]|uniref:Zinc-binding dehydrogenase n=1 Tax=Candidatus Segetimicrobium genomatis TaxID=2569760 RepID=A0A537LP41_9BACT|nr:MAG: zinc-binding dehydrogenase [Terrabacteria group bacterium ANGP1]